ncbi:hypothetical protein BN903_220 [Halorubrum sp. AJ67]|nr:hypothetical protein BN903_220 [Halorubrum sp. AJ67]
MVSWSVSCAAVAVETDCTIASYWTSSCSVYAAIHAVSPTTTIVESSRTLLELEFICGEKYPSRIRIQRYVRESC